jgi:hypothetical protein
MALSTAEVAALPSSTSPEASAISEAGTAGGITDILDGDAGSLEIAEFGGELMGGQTALAGEVAQVDVLGRSGAGKAEGKRLVERRSFREWKVMAVSFDKEKCVRDQAFGCAQRQSLLLEEDEHRIGEEAEEGEQQDGGEHQRDLEIVLGIHHLEADALVGADHLGCDEEQQRRGGGEAEPHEDRRNGRWQHDAAEDRQAAGAIGACHFDELGVDLLHAADRRQQDRKERRPEDDEDL